VRLGGEVNVEGSIGARTWFVRSTPRRKAWNCGVLSVLSMDGGSMVARKRPSPVCVRWTASQKRRVGKEEAFHVSF
jgi:hypothetical protein